MQVPHIIVRDVKTWRTDNDLLVAIRSVEKSVYWLIPPLACLLIYWRALFAWFQQDDFAWLGLHLSYYHPSDLWRLLFWPMA